jgi:hypothetical protein
MAWASCETTMLCEAGVADAEVCTDNSVLGSVAVLLLSALVYEKNLELSAMLAA